MSRLLSAAEQILQLGSLAWWLSEKLNGSGAGIESKLRTKENDGSEKSYLGTVFTAKGATPHWN